MHEPFCSLYNHCGQWYLNLHIIQRWAIFKTVFLFFYQGLSSIHLMLGESGHEFVWKILHYFIWQTFVQSDTQGETDKIKQAQRCQEAGTVGLAIGL